MAVRVLPAGMRYIEELLDPEALAAIAAGALHLTRAIRAAEGSARAVDEVRFNNHQHNLRSREWAEERMRRIEQLALEGVAGAHLPPPPPRPSDGETPKGEVKTSYWMDVDDKRGGPRSAVHFPGYGSEGHSLTYFRGNDQIPDFVSQQLIPRVSALPEVLALMRRGDLDWNFSFNQYRNTGKGSAGFNFHIDIPTNGVVTMIFTLKGPASFRIRPKDGNGTEHTIELVPNSLAFLSGESRWRWEHAVMGAPSEVKVGEVARYSLVLGCSDKETGRAIQREFQGMTRR